MAVDKIEKVNEKLKKSLEEEEEKEIENRSIYSQDRKPTEPPKKKNQTPPPPKKGSSKLKREIKEGNALMDSLYWYLAVCLILIPQLLPYISGWTLFGILVTLLWTVYSGWIKRSASIKWKRLWKQYEEERKLRAEDTHTIIRLNSKIDGMKEELAVSKQRCDDSYVIESKLIKNIEDLSAVITKHVT